ncbi:DUF3187 family protein [Vibrio quintilis]|uniref:DUF3187 family protein n=1 Tax=Vibrio quintilis TaxID=1117707 RepID=A0A1M7YUH1_9VIBR|nr:DUF3187 family protein [Vibrio quintilis]SHO56201.1 hypothetical protein VQ7734_01970 [Vibrio quintilis]
MNKRILFFIALLLISRVSFSAIQSRPFRTYPTSPYQSTSLATQLRSAFPVEHAEIFVTGSMSSVWAQSDGFKLDYYQNQTMGGLEWRFSPRMSAELKYQYAWAGNNGLDSLTFSFHDLLGISQNGRSKVKKHQFNIDSPAYGYSVHDFEGEVMASAIHGYLQYQVFTLGNQALSVGGSLYFNEVNGSPFETASFEQGAQINYSLLYGPHSFFSTFGVTYRSDDVLNTLPVKSFTTAWALGYGQRFTRNQELMLQYHGFEGVLKDTSEFSKPSHEVVLGYRYYYYQSMFELSATENIVNMDNSADIAFSAGIRLFL